MKIRQGFVSNSSSSSFFIYGCQVTSTSYLMKFVFKNKDETRGIIEDMREEYSFYDTPILNAPVEELAAFVVKHPEEFLEKYGFEYYEMDDKDFYIGICPSTIGDDETGKEFQNRVEKELKRLLGNKIKCYYLGEIYYN